MADEAFALSPISARAARPSEEDYEAIREAFMETSRGRWFLGEYAKRNRNADTAMVLEAVARIEDTLAAQQQPAPDNGLTEVLAAIRSAVEQARTNAVAALEGLALEEGLAPVRKGARIIKEISWRWREIGADSRICDLIDSQISAMEAGCGQISTADPGVALTAAFDLIEAEIDGFERDDDPIPATDDETTQRSDVINGELPGNTIRVPDPRPDDPVADAEDEAVLEMIALEMAAPDLADDEPFVDEEVPEAPSANPVTIEREIMGERAEPAGVSLQPPEAPAIEAPVESSTAPSLEPPDDASLGATIIASGILGTPTSTASDPFAPIRRMSQAEKIAFFS
jgi:hypothetical protein